MHLAVAITHAAMGATALLFVGAGVYLLLTQGPRASGWLFLLMAACQAVGAAMYFFR